MNLDVQQRRMRCCTVPYTCILVRQLPDRNQWLQSKQSHFRKHSMGYRHINMEYTHTTLLQHSCFSVFTLKVKKSIDRCLLRRRMKRWLKNSTAFPNLQKGGLPPFTLVNFETLFEFAFEGWRRLTKKYSQATLSLSHVE